MPNPTGSDKCVKHKGPVKCRGNSLGNPSKTQLL